jgi:mannose-6-phosphate isomerase-like protein (cupin superfamily)
MSSEGGEGGKVGHVEDANKVEIVGPCGVLAPHVHPRANEYFTVVEGEMDFGYITEMGLLDDGYVTFLVSPSLSLPFRSSYFEQTD